MLLDYVPGGELFTYMRKKGTFDLKTSLFYVSEITLAFEYLHSLQIVYRMFILIYFLKNKALFFS
jgi:protein kinase X